MAGRLVNALLTERVDLSGISALADIDLADLHNCAAGARHLSASEQMRLAAAVAALAPLFAVRAHALYTEAQKEQHASSVAVHDEIASTHRIRFSQVLTRSHSLVTHAERAAGRAVELRQEAETLRAAAKAVATARSSSRAMLGDVLKIEVGRFATAARLRGEPPERALALMKSIVQSALDEVPNERAAIMSDVLGWFVHAYYAA